jgi:hypothetical protein
MKIVQSSPPVRSSVTPIFVGFKTKEYSPFIFLGIEEYKKLEECILFSCSEVFCSSFRSLCAFNIAIVHYAFTPQLLQLWKLKLDIDYKGLWFGTT